jgi:AcrR family transcriptional regulator
MAMESVDRRIRRTRAQLRNALFALIEEGAYDAITVQDITDRADLSRATFYLHYRDKDELLFTNLQAMFDDIAERTSVTTLADYLAMEQGGTYQHSREVFAHVAANARLYKALLSEHGVVPVVHRALHYLAELFLRELALCTNGNCDAPRLPIGLVAHQLAGALYMSVAWWVANDLSVSIEYMAQAYSNMTTSYVMAVFGQPLDMAPAMEFPGNTGG